MQLFLAITLLTISQSSNIPVRTIKKVVDYENVSKISNFNIPDIKNNKKNKVNNEANGYINASNVIVRKRTRIKWPIHKRERPVSYKHSTRQTFDSSFSIKKARIRTEKYSKIKDVRSYSVGKIDGPFSNKNERKFGFNDDKQHEYFLSKISEILEKNKIFELDSMMHCSEEFLTNGDLKNQNLKTIVFWLVTLSKRPALVAKNTSLIKFEAMIMSMSAEKTLYSCLTFLKEKLSRVSKFDSYNEIESEMPLAEINIVTAMYLIEIFLKYFNDKIYHFFPQFAIVMNFIFNSKNSSNLLNLDSMLPTFLLMIIAENTYKELQIISKDTKDILYSNFYFERLLILNYLIREIFCSLNNISYKVKPENFKRIAEFMEHINFFNENKNKLRQNPISEEYTLFTYYNFYYSMLFLYIQNKETKNSALELPLFNIIGRLNHVFNVIRKKNTLNYSMILNDIEEKSVYLIKLDAFKITSRGNFGSKPIFYALSLLSQFFDPSDEITVLDRINRFNELFASHFELETDRTNRMLKNI
ncbi:hypothetical protein CWI38_0380p0030 [Hamiltosporidium tvaerminnensis]|uniref:Uncharacterized protein n=1 Tax=Hamiltosporidium tvaerminnensis TaxID=1176355 RepID=A0A4Q9M0R5_9MICR|nr:hypothetical protein CWI38_0380p0030 [Hamiltosporidium tvaerminnensis]